jgi:molybdopterin converting factor small subunit
VSRTAESTEPVAETTVEVRATGHVYDALPESRIEFAFEGSTLREFLDAFFDAHDVRDLVIATRPEEEVTDGWAPPPDDLPDDWTANPAGERTRAFARILVNGRFNEHRDGFDTALDDGDRVALVYPFVFCV